MTSPPSRGAWIEIFQIILQGIGLASPPSRGAWIEILAWCCPLYTSSSPPSRGAWIEIFRVPGATGGRAVAPLAGGVD